LFPIIKETRAVVDKLIWNPPQNDPDYAANQAKRQAWFDKIANKKNWKNPIKAWIDPKDFEDCSQASIFFTGAPLTIIGTNAENKIQVVAPGYYAVIGS
jgi:hypothetical protein